MTHMKRARVPEVQMQLDNVFFLIAVATVSGR